MPNNVIFLLECAGRPRRLVFSSFFCDTQAPVVIMCCSIYFVSAFCACQGGPKTRGLSIVLIHCQPLTS